MSENKTVVLAENLIDQMELLNNSLSQDVIEEPIKNIDNYKFKLEVDIVDNMKRLQAINLIQQSITEENRNNSSVYLTYLRSRKLTNSSNKQLQLLLSYLVFSCNMDKDEIVKNKENLDIKDKEELLDIVIEIIDKYKDLEIDLNYFEDSNKMLAINHYSNKQYLLHESLLGITNNTIKIKLIKKEDMFYFELINTLDLNPLNIVKLDYDLSKYPLELTDENIKNTIIGILKHELKITRSNLFNLLNTSVIFN